MKPQSLQTRISAILTALVLSGLSVLSLFSLLSLVSCGQLKEIKNNSDSYSDSSQQTEPIPTETVEPETLQSDPASSDNPLLPLLPNPFEGISFGGETVLLTVPAEAKTEFFGDRQGSVISAAVFQRNRSVEARIGISLMENTPKNVDSYKNGYADYLQQSSLSGTEIGIAAVPSELIYLAVSGILRDLSSLPVNLLNPWFDESFLNTVGIGGTFPFAVGDMTPSAWENSPAVLVSAAESDLLNFSYLYQVVRSQQWTLDFLNELATLLNTGIQRNALTVTNVSLSSMMYGSGLRLTERLENGNPDFCLPNIVSVESFTSLSNLFLLDQKNPVRQSEAAAQQGFLSGSTVLLVDRLGSAHTLCKFNPALKLVYLPLPKQDSSLTGYFTTPTQFSMLSVPTGGTQNLQVTATALDALGYDSALSLSVAFLQTYLTQYGQGDTAAAEMLSYILLGITFEPEVLWDSMLDQPWKTVQFMLTENRQDFLSHYMSRIDTYRIKLTQLIQKLSQQKKT